MRGCSFPYERAGSLQQPVPITVGTHTREYSEANTHRALANNGAVLYVTLAKEAVPNTAAVFGNRKCSSADNKGRWLDLDTFGNVCRPPVCTGPTATTIHDIDWVRGLANTHVAFKPSFHGLCYWAVPLWVVCGPVVLS
jgi:hypothetical protein